MSQQIEQPGYQRLQVTDQKQMTWANDKLNRKPYADRLTTLIKNTEGPYVIGLTSPWGSGKTFFLKAWHNQLVAEGMPCIYFNAWEKDASGDPLANLIAVCEQQAVDFKGTAALLKGKFEEAFQNLPGLLRGAGWLANLWGIPIGSTIDTSATVIEKIQEILNQKKDFTEQLEKLASEIDTNIHFPLFIIVDELDRCRPSYAINLLESIKHLFNVPHVVFLLAVDATQLLQQVEHTFGLKACVENGKIVCDPRQDYLGKFFDIYYNLPATDNATFVKNILSKVNIIEKYSNLFMNTSYNLKFGLHELITSDSDIFSGKSLRTLIQYIEKFSIYLRCYNNIGLDEIITAFLIIFIHNNNSNSSIGNKLSESTIDELKILESEMNNIDDEILWNKTNNNIYTPAFCSYMFIKFSMINIEFHELKKYTAYRRAGSAYRLGGNFYSTGLMESINLKKFTEVAPVVIARLRYLEDFTPVLPVKETSSAAEPLTDPSA